MSFDPNALKAHAKAYMDAMASYANNPVCAKYVKAKEQFAKVAQQCLKNGVGLLELLELADSDIAEHKIKSFHGMQTKKISFYMQGKYVKAAQELEKCFEGMKNDAFAWNAYNKVKGAKKGTADNPGFITYIDEHIDEVGGNKQVVIDALRLDGIVTTKEIFKSAPQTILAAREKLISKIEKKVESVLLQRQEELYWDLKDAVARGHLDRCKQILDTPNINMNMAEGLEGNRSLLCEALHRGHKEIVALLIKFGVDPSVEIKNGNINLEKACKAGSLELVKLLIQAGADVNKKEGPQSPLLIAADQGPPEILDLLIKAGARVDTPDVDGLTPLRCACQAGKTENVKLLIKAGADVNAQVPIGDSWSLLHIAAAANPDIVKLLIDAGANVNTQNSDGHSPLWIAASEGLPETVDLLIKADAHVNTPSNFGITPLHHASDLGKVKIVELLVKAGAHVNTQDKNGGSPLTYAINNGQTEITSLLIQAGADLHLAIANGTIKFAEACRSGSPQIVELLLENGIDVNKPDYAHVTPLIRACESGNLEVVKLLLNHGVEFTKEDLAENTALKSAILSGNPQIVELLIPMCNDPNATDDTGNSPLKYALDRGNKAIIKLLVDKGLEVSKEQTLGIMHRLAMRGELKAQVDINPAFNEVVARQRSGLSGLYSLFASRGIDLTKVASITIELRGFLEVIEKPPGFFGYICYALTSNPNIPLNRNSVERLIALYQNKALKNDLFIAVQGGATLPEVEKAISYLAKHKLPQTTWDKLTPEEQIERLNYDATFRRREGLALAEHVLTDLTEKLNEDPPTADLHSYQMGIAALRILERTELVSHHRLEKHPDISRFEAAAGVLLFATLPRLTNENETSPELHALFLQTLATLSKIDTVHYKENNFPTFLGALEILKDQGVEENADLICSLLKTMRTYHRFDALKNDPQSVSMLLEIIAFAEKNKHGSLLLELGLTLSLTPVESLLKAAYHIVQSPQWDRFASSEEQSLGQLKGDFDLISYRPITHDLRENISRRILDGLAAQLDKSEIDRAYQSYMDNPPSFPDVHRYEKLLLKTPKTGLRYMEALYLPDGKCTIRGINAKKGETLKDKALLDLLEKGAGAADLSHTIATQGTWAKIGQIFSSLDSNYVMGAFFSDGGALMTIKASWINEQIRIRQARNAAEVGSLHYVFYQTIPLEAMEEIFVPEELHQKVMHYAKIKARNVNELVEALKKAGVKITAEDDPNELFRLYQSIQEHKSELLPKLKPYTDTNQAQRMLPKEATFEEVVQENVRREIARKLVIAKTLRPLPKSKM